MSLNNVASSERVHIAFFGLRNAGKSSLVNKVTGQKLSLVSDVLGTTTDPVKKAMELLPLGPVVIIDTPGLDDEGELGEMRVKSALSVLTKTDIAVLVVDATAEKNRKIDDFEKTLTARNIPFITVYNKADLLAAVPKGEKGIYVSAKTGLNIEGLKEAIASLKPTEKPRKIVGDLLEVGDIVVLVTPIDVSAPKGRLILPQQQTIRDILDAGAIAIVTKETELENTLSSLNKKPKMVITDSQVFEYVSKIVPDDIPLTSFSILFARYKGGLQSVVEGAKKLSSLNDGDTILISEGCTHHRQCGDIGTIKLPNWIKNYSGKNLKFEFTSGGEFPEDLKKYALIIHCGGCMLNENEMKNRKRMAKDAGVPMTNYGIAIAQMHGILDRSLSPFKE